MMFSERFSWLFVVVLTMGLLACVLSDARWIERSSSTGTVACFQSEDWRAFDKLSDTEDVVSGPSGHFAFTKTLKFAHLLLFTCINRHESPWRSVFLPPPENE